MARTEPQPKQQVYSGLPAVCRQTDVHTRYQSHLPLLSIASPESNHDCIDREATSELATSAFIGGVRGLRDLRDDQCLVVFGRDALGKGLEGLKNGTDERLGVVSAGFEGLV